MGKAIYTVSFVPSPGSFGTLLRYKKEDETVWTTPSDPANPTTQPYYPVNLEKGNIYYISITSVGVNCTEKSFIVRQDVPADGRCCPENFTLAPDQSYCYRQDIQTPDIITTGICLAPSTLSPEYSGAGTRIYEPGYGLQLRGNYTLLNTAYWTGMPAGGSNSPMNKDAVWVDTDCDGSKDALTAGKVLQFTSMINLDSVATVFIGIGGDNTFRVDINGTTIVDCNTDSPAAGTDPPLNFTVWHLFPVILQAGPNYIGFSALGDGSKNDAFATVIYNNTAAELMAAKQDSDLNLLFRTANFIGNAVEIATCPEGWTLDTTGGAGHYICRRISTAAPIDC